MATLSENSRAMMVALTACRRCHRWCKEIAVIQSIPKTLEIANPVDRLLELLTKGSLATFMITDHIGHLKQLKILSGGKRSGSGTIQLGMSYFGLANICMAIVTAKKIFALKGDDDGVAKQRRTLYETLFKQFLMVFQMAHLSLIYVSHDAFVGLAGVISSYMDAVPQWPAPKPVAAVENGKAK